MDLQQNFDVLVVASLEAAAWVREGDSLLAWAEALLEVEGQSQQSLGEEGCAAQNGNVEETCVADSDDVVGFAVQIAVAVGETPTLHVVAPLDQMDKRLEQGTWVALMERNGCVDRHKHACA